MKWFESLRTIASTFFRRTRAERELEDEVHSYAELLSDEKMKAGMQPAEAYRAARIEMGGIEQVKEEIRTARRGARLEAIWQDLRYGARMLSKKPAFTATAVLTLALGIGANSAIFSVMNASLLAPLPVPYPERVAMVWTDNPSRGWQGLPASAGDYVDWKASGIFKSLAALDEQNFNVKIGNETERVDGLRTTPEWFEIQDTKPYLGRYFSSEDIRTAQSKVAVLSYDLWSSRFAKNPTVIGKSTIINGELYTIVGIAPQNTFAIGQERLYVPLVLDAATINDRGTRSLTVVGRLANGIPFTAAQQRMTALGTRLAKQYRQNVGDFTRLQAAADAYTEDVKTLVLLLLCAVGFVLLVACTNITNLLLVRGTARRKELAVRVAVGASRIRLVCQLIAENVLLAAIAGIVGILPAWGGILLIGSFKLQELPRPELLTLNSSVLIFTFALAVIAGILFGLASAWQFWRSDVSTPLKESERAHTADSAPKLRNLFVAAQVAITVILVAGAGLMLRSFLYLRAANPGYDAEHVLSMNLTLSGPEYDSPEKLARFYKTAIERLGSLPGARSAAATNLLPSSNDLHGAGISFAGRPDPKPGEVPIVLVGSVTSGYFRTMQIPILHGRSFDERDRANAPLTVIVDQEAASKFWKGTDPIGKQIKLSGKEPYRTVVGVVGSVEQSLIIKLAKGRVGQVYLPFPQVPKPDASLVISSQANPASLASAARHAVTTIDPNQPVFQVQTLADARAANRTPARIATVLLGLFAAVALLLAAIGIYGVIAYTVAQRTREIGIRIALGASKADLLKLAVGKGGLLVVIGAAVGLLGAAGLTQLMRSLLSGVSPNDPITFVAVVFLLAGTGIAASYLPARRASRIDPTVALRYE